MDWPKTYTYIRPLRKKAAEDISDEQLDEDISRLLDSQQASAVTNSSTSAALHHDSILDDSEDDEDEVNESLLVHWVAQNFKMHYISIQLIVYTFAVRVDRL